MKLIVSTQNQKFLPLTFVFNATLAYNRGASNLRASSFVTHFLQYFFPLSLYDSTIVPSASLNII